MYFSTDCTSLRFSKKGFDSARREGPGQSWQTRSHSFSPGKIIIHCYHYWQHCHNHHEIHSNSCSGWLSALSRRWAYSPSPFSQSSGWSPPKITRISPLPSHIIIRGTFPSGSKAGRLCLLLDPPDPEQMLKVADNNDLARDPETREKAHKSRHFLL